MMYACVLIPRELSLVLTLHPNPMHMLEMSATVWSNTHLPPGAIFYPDEGEVRLDRIESRMVIPDGDIRRFYGCYDTMMNVNGQEVRHCNWVRFVKSTTEPDDANMISSKVRGQSFYQVIRPVKPNEEIVVLFHVTAERSLYDRLPSSPYAPYSLNQGPHYAYSNMYSPLLIRQDHRFGLATSTPITTKIDDINPVAQTRSLKFESSSSSSSTFTSPQFDTPNRNRFARNAQLESSFTSPVGTTSSSRETSGSDNHSGSIIQDAQFVKGDNQTKTVVDERYSDTPVADTNEQDSVDHISKKRKRQDTTNDNSADQPKEVEVDVVNETFIGNDNVKDEWDEHGSESSLSDDEVDNRHDAIRSVEEGEKGHPRTPLKTSCQPGLQEICHSEVSCHKRLTPTFKLEKPESLADTHKSDMVMRLESVPSTTIQLSDREINAANSLQEGRQSPASTTADSTAYIHNLVSRRRCSSFEDIKFSGNDISSTNETGTFLLKLSLSPKPATKLDLLHSVGSPDRSQLKRCRERSWWPCDVCGKRFDRPSLLKRHTRTHTGEKPHACDVCGKAFSTSSSLNTHRRIHSGEKPHQCKTCGKRFTASSNLYYHRMTHNKEKPHKCDVCSKSFPTPGDLRSHMYVHNGSWPFRCDVCNRGFSKQTNLKNHRLLHSGDKPHECIRCDKKFALLCNLKTHMRTHDNSESSDCTECLKCGVAITASDDLHETICKRCSNEPLRIAPKPTTPSLSTSLRQQRNTDFSISKLTSSDVKTPSSAPERHYTLSMPPAMLYGNSNAKLPSGLVNPSYLASPQLQIPAVYRQFLPAAPGQHKWLIPAPSSHIFAPQFLAGSIKHPDIFHGSLPKQGDQQTKIENINPAHSGIPAFITPEMSLQGGTVFPSVAHLPSGYSLLHGSTTWGGHIMAQGLQ